MLFRCPACGADMLLGGKFRIAHDGYIVPPATCSRCEFDDYVMLHGYPKAQYPALPK